jgi:D-cysteine desulfhydrase
MDLPERLSLAHLPTPVHRLDALSDALGSELYVKRDDLTGSHLSGNKIRKLEYLLAEAVAQKATHVLTCGGIQSNHCRATALAVASLGMKPELLLRTANGHPSDLPSPSSGNVLLDRLSGATVHLCDPDGYRETRAERMDAIAKEITARGGRPVIVPEGGSNALGSLGYVHAARELVEQLGRDQPTAVWVAVGSGGTLAGLALGFKALGVPYRAIGVPVCDDAATFREIVQRISATASEAFGLPALEEDDYDLIEGFQGRGYALTTAPELAVLRDAVQRDGLVLDHVYTGKAYGALLSSARNGQLGEFTRTVFVHTGGIFGLGAAASQLDALLNGAGDGHP